MTNSDKKIVIAALLNLAIYSPVFLGFAAYEFYTRTNLAVFEQVIVPWHIMGMLLMFLAFYITLKDLVLRPFPNSNVRFRWLVLILMTGGIGWFVYLYRYGFKPRTSCK